MTTTFLKNNYDNFIDFVRNNAKCNGLLFITELNNQRVKEIKTHITQSLANDGDAIAFLSNRTQTKNIKYTFNDLSSLVKECADFYKKDFSPARTNMSQLISGRQYKRVQINAASHNFNSGAGMFVVKDASLSREGMICIENKDGAGKYRFWIDNNDVHHFECKRNVEKLDPSCLQWSVDAVNSDKRVIYLFLEKENKFFEYLGEFYCIGVDYFPDAKNPQKAFLNLRKISSIPDFDAQNNNNLQNTSANVDDTTKKRLISARVGQGYYREQLLKKFNSTCVISGIQGLDELLIASHIKAWSASDNDERLDCENGLLLSATYDKLFDNYLISFTNDGNLIVSDLVPPDIKQKLQLIPGKKFNIKPSVRKSKYLEWHRERLMK